MYENRHQRLASRHVFARRLLRHAAASVTLVAVSLLIGVLGYHLLEALPWLDALLNAAMLLGGMGPVDALHTSAGKLFAAAYALYCGLVALIAASILLAPLLHRLLHRFHVEPGSERRE